MSNKLVWEGGERRIPKRYSGFSSLANSCVMVRLRYALPYIEMHYNIIDLGCGTGWNTKFMSLYCDHIWGIDVSQDAIEYAISINDAKNITWLKKRMHDLAEFKDSSIDMITTIASIEHNNKNELEAVLEQAHRVLKPHGMLVGTTTQFREHPRIDATPWHKYEPGFSDFKDIASKYFIVETLENFTISTPDLSKTTIEGLFIFKSRKA